MPENQCFILPASFTSSTPFPITCPEPCMRWWRGSIYKWAFNRHLFSYFDKLWVYLSSTTTNKQTKTKSYPDKIYSTSNGQKSYFSGKHFDRHNLSTQQNNSINFLALYVNFHGISYLCYEFLNFHLFIYLFWSVCVRKHPYVCLHVCGWVLVTMHRVEAKRKCQLPYFMTFYFVPLR